MWVANSLDREASLNFDIKETRQFKHGLGTRLNPSVSVLNSHPSRFFVLRSSCIGTPLSLCVKAFLIIWKVWQLSTLIVQN